jgi:DNA-binding response OmpR family regulator
VAEYLGVFRHVGFFVFSGREKFAAIREEPDVSHELDGMAQFPIDDYFVKPLAPDRLAGRLHTLLDHPGPRFTLFEQMKEN